MQLEVIRRTPAAPSTRPPLLFIHGAYHGAWCWEEHFLAYFAERGYDAVAFSLRGHGQSAGRERIAHWGLNDYLEDVRQVAGELDQPPVVVGHSLGGVLALLCLAEQEAAAAVLLAPAAVGAMRRDALRWLVRHPWASVTSFLTRDMRRLLPTFRRHFFAPHTPQEVADRYLARMQEESFRVISDQTRLAPPVLKNANTPMLLLSSAYDSIPPHRHKAMARRYGATLRTFDLGHELMLEPEWRIVAECMDAWLTAIEVENRKSKH